MNQFNWKHYIFIATAFVVVPIKTYTSIYLKETGNESWITLIIASIILCLYVFISMRIFTKNNCYNISEIYQVALGNLIGKVFLVYLMLTILIALTETAAVITSLLHTNLLLETPIWYSLLFIVGTGLLVGGRGSKSVILTIMITVLIIAFFGINLSILTFKYKNYSRMLPVFQKSYGDYMISTLRFLGGLSYYVLSFIYLDRIHVKDKIHKGVIISLIFVIQLIFVSVTGQIATFQSDRIIRMTYPSLFQTQLIEDNNLLGVGELFVILQIMLGWLVRYVVLFKSIFIMLEQLKWYRPYLKYIVSGIVYILAYVFNYNLFRFRKILDICNFLVVLNILLIPGVIYIIFHFRNKKKRQQLV